MKSVVIVPRNFGDPISAIFVQGAFAVTAFGCSFTLYFRYDRLGGVAMGVGIRNYRDAALRDTRFTA